MNLNEMKLTAPPTRERFLEAFDCDPVAGVLRWRISQNWRVKIGDIAGCVRGGTQRSVNLDGVRYLVHRLIWFYATDEWPDEIDFIDDDPLNCAFANLRKTTRAESAHRAGPPRHNTSGVKGVFLCNRTKRWGAQIQIHNKRKWLGRHPTREAAQAVYDEAENRAFGDLTRAA
jgi:hypothetical protein